MTHYSTRTQALLFLFISFGVVHPVFAQKYFKVLSATSQTWAGGMPQTGSGQTYNITLLLKSNGIQFSDLWIGQTPVPFEVRPIRFIPDHKPSRGDTVTLIYTKHFNGSIPNEEPKSHSAPPKYSGEALFKYSCAGKSRYQSVIKIKVLPNQNYP